MSFHCSKRRSRTLRAVPWNKYCEFISNLVLDKVYSICWTILFWTLNLSLFKYVSIKAHIFSLTGSWLLNLNSGLNKSCFSSNPAYKDFLLLIEDLFTSFPDLSFFSLDSSNSTSSSDSFSDFLSSSSSTSPSSCSAWIRLPQRTCRTSWLLCKGLRLLLTRVLPSSSSRPS